jgi:multiple sugar transport system permease protein
MKLAQPAFRDPRPGRGRLRPGAFRSLPYRVFRFVSLILVVLFFIGPIVWMILASFKTAVDIYNPANTFVFTLTSRTRHGLRDGELPAVHME